VLVSDFDIRISDFSVFAFHLRPIFDLCGSFRLAGRSGTKMQKSLEKRVRVHTMAQFNRGNAGNA
jgi:hypothetical protein